MANSAAQTVNTVPVWDYMLASGNPTKLNPLGVQGRTVRITLEYAQGSSASPNPVTAMDTAEVVALTDNNGFWQVHLVPTDQMNPSGMLYKVQVGDRPPYLINPVAAGVPAGGWQSSAIIVNA